MTKRISSIYEEHPLKIETDRPEKKISKLIRLLTFTTDEKETLKIIKQIQYYQNLIQKINDKNQTSLFD
jgi:hypothetical protein